MFHTVHPRSTHHKQIALSHPNTEVGNKNTVQKKKRRTDSPLNEIESAFLDINIKTILKNLPIDSADAVVYCTNTPLDPSHLETLKHKALVALITLELNPEYNLLEVTVLLTSGRAVQKISSKSLCYLEYFHFNITRIPHTAMVKFGIKQSGKKIDIHIAHRGVNIAVRGKGICSKLTDNLLNHIATTVTRTSASEYIVSSNPISRDTVLYIKDPLAGYIFQGIQNTEEINPNLQKFLKYDIEKRNRIRQGYIDFYQDFGGARYEKSLTLLLKQRAFLYLNPPVTSYAKLNS